MEEFISKLNESYQSLSPGFQKIAKYLSEKMTEAMLLNSTEMANKTSVSEATLTRFIKHLGYNGFTEFRRDISQMVVDDLAKTKTLAESAQFFEDSKSIFAEVIRDDIESIGRLPSYISEKLFNEVVETLTTARNVYVLGLRSSYAVAFYFAFIMRPLLNSLRLIRIGVGDLPEQIMDADKQDILLVICLKRYTKTTYDIMEQFKKRGTKIITITSDPFSLVGQISDVKLIVKTDTLSYTAPMSLMNAFINAMIIKKKSQYMSAIKRHEQALEDFDTYIE